MKKIGSAIILAGGKSIRMGFDKQKVLIGGVSMVCYIAEQLEKLFEEIIIVTNTPDYYKELGSCEKYKIVWDIYKEKGPLGGLHVGLLNASSEWAYVIACDMPIVNTAYILMMKQLIVKEKLDGHHTFGCVTELKGFVEPFNAFYSTAKHSDVEKGILMGHLKFSRFVLEHNSRVIEEEQALKYSKDLTMFMNLNTLMNLKKNDLLGGVINLPA